jgi:hypothetical protein
MKFVSQIAYPAIPISPTNVIFCDWLAKWSRLRNMVTLETSTSQMPPRLDAHLWLDDIERPNVAMTQGACRRCAAHRTNSSPSIDAQ